MLSRWYAAFKQFLELNDLDDAARIWNADETGALSVPNLAKFSDWLEQVMSTKLRQIQRNRILQFLLQGILFHQCTYFLARDFDTTHSRVVSVELTLANLKRVG